MEEARVRAWFAQYLETIAALGRGESDDHGSEIGRLGVTYLITDGPAGLRALTLAIHTP